MAFIDDLLELFDAEITVQPGTTDGAGTWSAAGSASTFPCRYEEGMRMTQDTGGQPVQSTLFCVVAGVLPSFDPSKLRFTIPNVYIPFENVRAIRVDPVRDETGIIAAEVSLP